MPMFLLQLVNTNVCLFFFEAFGRSWSTSKEAGGLPARVMKRDIEQINSLEHRQSFGGSLGRASLS